MPWHQPSPVLKCSGFTFQQQSKMHTSEICIMDAVKLSKDSIFPMHFLFLHSTAMPVVLHISLFLPRNPMHPVSGLLSAEDLVCNSFFQWRSSHSWEQWASQFSATLVFWRETKESPNKWYILKRTRVKIFKETNMGKWD